MSDARTPRYGTVDRDYGMRPATPPDDDGPVWMVNLMRYREVADHTDGRESRSAVAKPTICTRRSGHGPPSALRSRSPVTSTSSCSATRRRGIESEW